MGLDITAYQQIKPIDCLFDSGGDPVDVTTREPLTGDWTQFFLNPDFKGRADEITHKGVYSYASAHGFRAGSYSGYNGWRENLAELAGYAATPYEQYGVTRNRHDAGAWAAGSGPFWELIYFSDCEGAIGTKVAQKLAKDFADFQEKANSFADEIWRARYAEWRRAFEMAADNGAVSFH